MARWVEILGGQYVPAEFQPLAMAYAGHQFGQWAGQLGDGRGLLMAQVLDNNGQPQDLHLKGAWFDTLFTHGRWARGVTQYHS